MDSSPTKLNWKVRPTEELQCPDCGGPVRTIHPFYGATEYSGDRIPYWQVLKLIPVWIIWEIWWPLGIAAFLMLVTYEIVKVKRKILYECETCQKKMSYEEIENTE